MSLASEQRGRARCEACAKHLTVKPSSFVAVVAMMALVVALVSLLYGALNSYGGPVLAVIFTAVCAAAGFVSAYLVVIRFEVASDRSPTLTAARLADLEG